MILCIGSAADETFCHTLDAFNKANIKMEVLEIGQLALSGEIEFAFKDLDRAVISLREKKINLNDFQGAWIRLIDISEAAPTSKLRQKALGFYRSLNLLFSYTSIPTLNPPLKDLSNFSKVFHAVSLGAIGGCNIPKTCLTNKIGRARTFIAECDGEVIFKGSSGMKTWATLYSRDLHEERLSYLKTSPVLFQERIEGPDVRVHVVGKKLFAESIESDGLDYRVNAINRYQNISLPPDIVEACYSISRSCGIPFLGIDFKIQRNSGEWFFLEANSMPCYQGYDRRVNGSISKAIVEWFN